MTEIILPHGIEYPDNSGITLSDVAQTLIAHETIIKLISDILEKSFGGIRIESVRINLKEIKIGSLSEAFFVALFVVYQDDLEQEVPDMIEKLTSYNVPGEYDTIVTIIILVLIFYGAQYLIGKMRGNNPELSAPTIYGNYNTYVQLASDKLNISADTLKENVEATAKGVKKRSLGRAAIDFFRPAKKGGTDGRILPRGTPEVSREAVGEFPNEAALAELSEETVVENFTNVLLTIRATDMDKQKQGWAGFVHHEGFKEDKRIRFALYPTVDAEALSGCRQVRADILVEFMTIGDGALIPKCIHVIKVNEEIA